MAEQRKFGSLEEMRQALGGETSVAKCRECGKPLPEGSRHPTCSECYYKQRDRQNSGGSSGDRQAQSSGQSSGRSNYAAPYAPARLPEGYLAQGYFQEVTDAPANSKNSTRLRDELITTQALELAKAFASIGLTTGQLRRFYSHVRYAAQRLEYGEAFANVRPAILELEPMVAGAVGRAKNSSPPRDYELFKQFIDRNIARIDNKEAFVHGFVPHFQYVVAYFTYINPKG